MRIEFRTNQGDANQPEQPVELIVQGKFCNIPVKDVEGDHQLIVLVTDEGVPPSNGFLKLNGRDINITIEYYHDTSQPLALEKPVIASYTYGDKTPIYTAHIDLVRWFSSSVPPSSFTKEVVKDFKTIALGRESLLAFGTQFVERNSCEGH